MKIQKGRGHISFICRFFTNVVGTTTHHASSSHLQVSVSQLKITTEFMAGKVKLELSRKKTSGLFSPFCYYQTLGLLYLDNL